MRVPTYNPQVDRAVVSQPTQSVEAYGGVTAKQTTQLAQAADQAGEGFDRVAVQQAQTEAFNAEAQARKDWITYSAELKKNRQGTGAQGVAADVEKWWTENAAKYGADKGGRAGRMIKQSVQRMQLQALDEFKRYELHQGEVAADAAVEANVHSAISSIAANPSIDNVALQRAGITAAVRAHAAARGWPPEVLNDKLATQISAGTIAAFNTLLARNPKEAREFWNANRETVRGEQRDEIETRLKSAVAGMEGNEAADQVWTSMGPKNDLDAVEIDKMAGKIREQFKDQPETLKAALQSLRERATEHNAAQAERAAQNTNAVMGVWNKTKSLAQIKRTAEWAALPEKQKATIEEHIESQQLMALNRANAAANRDLLNEERQQRRLKQQGFAAYLQYGDPRVLAGMSDAQVQALLPALGNELTEHLITKKRSLASAEATRVAAIDKNDFDAIAQEFKLRPFGEKKSEEEKAALGTLQYRVEQLIDLAQRNKKAPLDRQEKQALMRQEMARQVLVDPGLFSFEKQVPVIALKADDVKNVKVPAADRAAITEAMRTMYERTKRAEFAPSEENLKRFYLRRQSPAADLIPNGQ